LSAHTLGWRSPRLGYMKAANDPKNAKKVVMTALKTFSCGIRFDNTEYRKVNAIAAGSCT
jgi:hypothetical protein